MPLLAAIPFFALICLTVGGAVYFWVVWWRVRRVLRTLPTARDGLTLDEEVSFWPPVCVIIPAHNEESVIGDLVRSLRAQDYRKMRVVLALDRCTDETEAVVRREATGADGELDQRFEIVRIDSCPDDWAGKVHAAHCGVTRSEGAESAELLLFADADTWFDPGCLRATVAILRQRRLDLLSLLSSLTTGRWFERMVQPAAGFELVRRYPLDRLNRDAGEIRFANGQFMLFRREAYDNLGGHERVKGELLEDLAFARWLVRDKRRMRLGVLLADGMLRCRMYDDWPGFRRGWKRIYIESVHCAPARLRRSAGRVLLTGVLLPVAWVASMVSAVAVWVITRDEPLAIALGTSGAIGALAYAMAMRLVYKTQGLPSRLIFGYPIGAWLTRGILSEAAQDLDSGKKTVWGGREYARQATDS